MKIVIVGGTGLIGRPLVGLLRAEGHEVVAASPSTGIDALTGAGLAQALTDAAVVVDVSNAPSFEDAAALAFFRGTTTNLLEAARDAGVRHVVALSVVGTDRLQASGYFRAKLAQEQLIAAGGIPYTIVRATQFFEFLSTIADGYTRDKAVYLPAIALQPVAAADVSALLAEIATAARTVSSLKWLGRSVHRWPSLPAAGSAPATIRAGSALPPNATISARPPTTARWSQAKIHGLRPRASMRGLPLSRRRAQHEPEPSAARSRVRCQRPLHANLTSKLVFRRARRHHHRPVQPAFRP
jgi:hypothetical protein